MANAVRHDFHTDLATLVCNDIQYQKANYYYYIGKIESWGNGTDSSPTVVDPDTGYANNIIRSNILFTKKIEPNDASLVVDRVDWTSGVVYDRWDHTIDMINLNFYCVTDENIVYKCLDNNNRAPSTVKPSGVSFYHIKTNDGYVWKYMYTIPSFKRSRFMTLNYMPVQTALSDSFYNKGSIDEVVVTNAGSGYVDVLLTSISVTGSTTGSGALGHINVSSATGAISSITVTNGGTAYTAGVNVDVTTSTGYGATFTPVINGGGTITSVTVNNPGVGYVNGETVVFSVGGAVIIPSVSRVTNSIVGLNIIKSGAGYTTTPTLTVIGAGTGVYGNGTALVSAVKYQGKIVRANILDPGTGYLADTDTSIVVVGDGTGAQFTPVIYNGSIVNIVVENPGAGYTSASLTVVGEGTGAKLNAVTASSDFTSDQSIVEQTVIVGAVYAVKVTEPGNNYTSYTTVTVNGDGTGCLAHPVIVDGEITNVVIDNPGSGYSYATVTFTDPGRELILVKTDASAYIILPPENGHGYNAVKELHASTLAINSSIRQDALLDNLSQNYRQFGIIKNITNIVTGKKLTNSAYLIVYEVVIANTTGMVLDEILIQNNIKFRVVAINNNVVTLQQLGSSGNVVITSLFAETNVTRTYTVGKNISYPIANKYSGSLLYTSDEQPFTFSQNQGITIKTFLNF